MKRLSAIVTTNGVCLQRGLLVFFRRKGFKFGQRRCDAAGGSRQVETASRSRGANSWRRHFSTDTAAMAALLARGRRCGTALAMSCQGIEDCRFQSAEAEIQPFVVDKGTRQLDRPGVALSRLTLNRRASGKAKPQQTRHLVERLAGRVVKR